MGIGFSFIGLIVILLGVFAVVGVVAQMFRSRSSSQSPQAAAGVTLKCPHCAQETDASQHRCQHCDRDL